MTLQGGERLEYIEREIGLIEGTVEPKDNKEWEWSQDHANDIVPPLTISDKPAEYQLPKSDFRDRIRERAERKEDYMRNGS